jgi:hypothetical protein
VNVTFSIEYRVASKIPFPWTDGNKTRYSIGKRQLAMKKYDSIKTIVSNKVDRVCVDRYLLFFLVSSI